MKRIILIMSSVILLLLSFLSINQKIIQPYLENKRYEKELAKFEQNMIQKAEEYNNKKEEELQKIQEEEYVKIPLPETEEEICKTVIGKYFHYINSKKYEDAYAMLDEKFKQNYFATYEEYQKYCTEKFADYKVLEYIKYERRTDFILVKIVVKNLADRNIQEEMQINIAEKGNYTYTISFGIEG